MENHRKLAGEPELKVIIDWAYAFKVIYGSMTQGLSVTILRKNNSESTNINFRLNPNAHINSYVDNVFKHSQSTMKERHV